LKKTHLLNLFAGLIIVGVWIFHIAIGGYPVFPLSMIGLFVVSYFMERKGVNSFLLGNLNKFIVSCFFMDNGSTSFFWSLNNL
jgi:hypothetical protein